MAQTPFANPELKLETVTTSEETLIRCTGKLTYTSCEVLRSTVHGLLPQTKRLVLDLKDMTYLDSFGLGVLVGVYLSANPTLSTLDRRIDLRSTVLSAGDVNTRTLALTVPYTMPAGAYYVGAIIDPSNAIAEYDESNNTAVSSTHGGKVLVLAPKAYLPLLDR